MKKQNQINNNLISLSQLEYKVKQSERKVNTEISKRYYQNHKEDKLEYARSYYYSKKYENQPYDVRKEVIIFNEPIILTFD